MAGQETWQSDNKTVSLVRFSLGVGRGISVQLSIRDEHTTLSRGEAADLVNALRDMLNLPVELFH